MPPSNYRLRNPPTRTISNIEEIRRCTEVLACCIIEAFRNSALLGGFWGISKYFDTFYTSFEGKTSISGSHTCVVCEWNNIFKPESTSFKHCLLGQLKCRWKEPQFWGSGVRHLCHYCQAKLLLQWNGVGHKVSTEEESLWSEGRVWAWIGESCRVQQRRRGARVVNCQFKGRWESIKSLSFLFGSPFFSRFFLSPT